MHILCVYLTKGHVRFWLGFSFLLMPSFLAPMQHSNSKSQASTQNATSSILLSALYENTMGSRYSDEEMDIKKRYDRTWTENIFHGKALPVLQSSKNGSESQQRDPDPTRLSPQELTELGFRYDCGMGVPLNREKAVKYYVMATDKGYAQAQFLLGCCYERGNGTVANREKAFECYQQAALQGNTDAQFKLGVCYQYGFGTVPNPAKAIACYKLARRLFDCNLHISHSFATLTACNYADWLRQQKAEEAEEQRIKQRYDTVWYKLRNKKNRLGRNQQQIAKEIYAVILEFPQEIAQLIAEYAYSLTGKHVATLTAHTSIINTLVVLPNGSFASAGDDQVIKIWKITYERDGTMFIRCLQNLIGCPSSINALAMLPDGTLAAGHANGVIVTWVSKATPTGIMQWERHHFLREHKAFVLAIIALPTKAFISASGPFDETIKIWEQANGESTWTCAQTLCEHQNCITALANLQEGFASASYDESVKIWAPKTPGNNRTWHCIQTLEGHTKHVVALVTLDNGSLASASEDCSIRIWSPKIEQNKVTLRCSQILDKHNNGHKQDVYALTKLPTGALVSGSGDGTIKVWEASFNASDQIVTRQCVKTISECGIVCSLIVLPTGELIAGNGNGEIKVLE